MEDTVLWEFIGHGPLTRYVKPRVVHAPGMPRMFSPPPISKETATLRSRHASRHVRHAGTVMHVGIANSRCRGKRSRHSRHAQPTILRIGQQVHSKRIFVRFIVANNVSRFTHTPDNIGKLIPWMQGEMVIKPHQNKPKPICAYFVGHSVDMEMYRTATKRTTEQNWVVFSRS